LAKTERGGTEGSEQMESEKGSKLCGKVSVTNVRRGRGVELTIFSSDRGVADVRIRRGRLDEDRDGFGWV